MPTFLRFTHPKKRPCAWCVLLVALSLGCNPAQPSYADVRVVGAMKHVMWKGELGESIRLDTLSKRAGLYGLGPESYLTGELLINDGRAYVSRVRTDSTLSVEREYEVSAPFFVYANVEKWETLDLPDSIATISQLEVFIDERTRHQKRPFAFKLTGRVVRAKIHVQNLPLGSRVSSPQEAHRGQTNYPLRDEAVEIVGFFSTEHAGIFTHHDTFLHLHLITRDERMMGHLDEVEFGGMKLHLPVK